MRLIRYLSASLRRRLRVRARARARRKEFKAEQAFAAAFDPTRDAINFKSDMDDLAPAGSPRNRANLD